MTELMDGSPKNLNSSHRYEYQKVERNEDVRMRSTLSPNLRVDAKSKPMDDTKSSPKVSDTKSSS